MPVHLNLTVGDVERSIGFYARWLGFGLEERRFGDGTVFVRDAEGTDLAFHAAPAPVGAAPGFHFGFRRATPSSVHELRAGLIEAGVRMIESEDGPDVVSVKFADPDGYTIEVYWEPSGDAT